MTTAQRALLSLALFLLLLLGLAFYGYQRLPELLNHQAETYLRDYGVEQVSFGPPHIKAGQFTSDELHLRGTRDGLAFAATLTGLEVNFDWRKLRDGELESVSLDGLKLSLRETTVAAEPVERAADGITVAALLPHTLRQALPLHSLTVQQWSLEYVPLVAAPVMAEGTLQVAAQLSLQWQAHALGSAASGQVSAGPSQPLHLQLQLYDGDIPLGGLDAQLAQSDDVLWRWSLRGDVRHAALMSWLGRLGEEGSLPGDWSLPAGLLLQGHSELEAEITHADVLQLSPPAGKPLVSQFDIQATVSNNIEQLAYSGYVEAVSGQFDVALKTSAQQTELVIGSSEITGVLHTAPMQLPQSSRNWLRWGKSVAFRWHNPQDIRIASAEDSAWSLQARDGELTVGNTGHTGSELRWQSLALDMLLTRQQSSQQVWPATVALTALVDTRLRAEQLPAFKLGFSHKGVHPSSEFELSLDDVAESMALALRGELDLDTGKGESDLHVRSLDLSYASSVVLPLLRKFGLLHEQAALAGGSIDLHTILSHQGFSIEQLAQRSELKLQRISGGYDDYRFEGLNLAASWRGIEQWQTLQPATLSMEKLFVGFDLTNTQALIALPKPTPIAAPVVKIDRFSTGTFGGRLFLPEPLRWDFASASNSVTLRVEDWQLRNIVALQQDQDIEAQGILEGELPLTVAAGRLIIDKGYLEARPPGGHIRYTTGESRAALAESSPELELALDLLDDFNYQILSGRVDLDKAGNLLLGLSLAGNNPNQFEGRPVQFNINLEQNIDPLLQSLRLNDTLLEQLENKLQ